MATGTAVDKPRDRAPVIVRDIQESRDKLAVLLPAGVSIEAFERTVLNAIARDPGIAQCSRASILDACAKAAKDGLVLDGREAALVIHKRNEKIDGNWVEVGRDATYIPMIAGIRKRLFATGLIAKMDTGIVYAAEVEQDRFEFVQGSDGFIRHKPIIVGDRGAPVAAWSSVTFKSGEVSTEVMRWDEILVIAKRAGRGKLGTVWENNLTEMARKTVARRHAKVLPLDAEASAFLSEMDRDDAAAQAQAGEEDQIRTRASGAAAARLRQHRAAPAAEPIDPPHDDDGVFDHDPPDPTSPAEPDYQDVI